MKFSFFMMPIHLPSENPALAFDRDISLIHYAEELDFDEFFIGEHHSGGWENMPAPELALAKAAAHAKRIRLGTSVINTPFHHPFHVAERMAFLDHLTRGRAILGVGPSALVTDKKLFGLDNEKLHAMLNESVDVIVRLLESPEPIDHHGEFWSFEGMRLQLRSYQQPRMPLAVASSGTSGSLEMVGKHDMMLLSPAGKNRWRNPAHSEQWKTVEAAAAKYGKTAKRDNWRIATSVYLAETREQAWADVEAGIARDMQYFFAIGLQEALRVLSRPAGVGDHAPFRRGPARLDHRHPGRRHPPHRAHAAGDRRIRRPDAHHPRVDRQPKPAPLAGAFRPLRRAAFPRPYLGFPRRVGPAAPSRWRRWGEAARERPSQQSGQRLAAFGRTRFPAPPLLDPGSSPG